MKKLLLLLSLFLLLLFGLSLSNCLYLRIRLLTDNLWWTHWSFFLCSFMILEALLFLFIFFGYRLILYFWCWFNFWLFCLDLTFWLLFRLSYFISIVIFILIFVSVLISISLIFKSISFTFIFIIYRGFTLDISCNFFNKLVFIGDRWSVRRNIFVFHWRIWIW